MAKKPEPLSIAWDSGEEEPRVLINMAKRKEIALVKTALNVGDYTVIPYADRCCIETKWSIADLAGSFTARRKQFEAMWVRAWAHEMKVLIIVGNWDDLEYENYRADFPKESFQQTLLQWQIKYGFVYVFVPNKAVGLHRVYLYCKAFQRTVDRGTLEAEPPLWRRLYDTARATCRPDNDKDDLLGCLTQLAEVTSALQGTRGKS